MSGFLNAVSASFVLLLLMSVGYFMGHLGWMTAPEKKFISKYLINIAIPCNCITGLLNNLDRERLVEAGGMILAAAVEISAMLVLAAVAALVLRLPRDRWGVFVVMSGLSNTLFIGIPVCTQLFGEVSVPYVMIYYLAHMLFVQVVGYSLVEFTGIKRNAKFSVSANIKKVFIKPPVVTACFAALMLALGIQLPAPIMSFAGYISGSVSPMALLYCGYIIHELGLRNLRFMKGLPTMLVLRLGVAPVICWGLCRLFHIQELAMSVFIVESALPVISQAPVMAGTYGADEQYAATGAALSTLFSFISIPVLMLLLG